MRIVCPACETAYDVPETVLAPGRAVRCARCRSEWVPEGAPAREEASEAEEPAPEEPVPIFAAEPVVRVVPPPAADRPAGARVAVIAGWLVSLLLLGGMGYAAVAWRQPIEQAWPPAGRAYGWLGYS